MITLIKITDMREIMEGTIIYEKFTDRIVTNKEMLIEHLVHENDTDSGYLSLDYDGVECNETYDYDVNTGISFEGIVFYTI